MDRLYLGQMTVDITLDLQDSLQGNMREIIGTLSLKEINTDRDIAIAQAEADKSANDATVMQQVFDTMSEATGAGPETPK